MTLSSWRHCAAEEGSMFDPASVRFRGPLTAHVDGFWRALQSQGYPPLSGRNLLLLALISAAGSTIAGLPSMTSPKSVWRRFWRIGGGRATRATFHRVHLTRCSTICAASVSWYEPPSP